MTVKLAADAGGARAMRKAVTIAMRRMGVSFGVGLILRGVAGHG
jgi:hypothetical protein